MMKDLYSYLEQNLAFFNAKFPETESGEKAQDFPAVPENREGELEEQLEEAV